MSGRFASSDQLGWAVMAALTEGVLLPKNHYRTQRKATFGSIICPVFPLNTSPDARTRSVSIPSSRTTAHNVMAVPMIAVI
jgi:hypothetical protein